MAKLTQSNINMIESSKKKLDFHSSKNRPSSCTKPSKRLKSLNMCNWINLLPETKAVERLQFTAKGTTVKFNLNIFQLSD